MIDAAAQRHGVRPALLRGLVEQESQFKIDAVSSAGARGLTQLMPGTARELGVDPGDPAQALDGGARYLSQQLKRFDGNEELALAAYNAGPGAVQRYGGIPPFRETQGYVRKVLGNAARYGGTTFSQGAFDPEGAKAPAATKAPGGGLMQMLQGSLLAGLMPAIAAAPAAKPSLAPAVAEMRARDATPQEAAPARAAKAGFGGGGFGGEGFGDGIAGPALALRSAVAPASSATRMAGEQIGVTPEDMQSKGMLESLLPGILTGALTSQGQSGLTKGSSPLTAKAAALPASGSWAKIPGISTGNTGASTGPHLDVRWKDRQPIAPGDVASLLKIGGKGVSDYTVTSPYGMRTHPVHGGRRLHAGFDLATPAGLPLEVAPGVRLGRKFWDEGGGGWVQELETPGGRTLQLLHLESRG